MYVLKYQQKLYFLLYINISVLSQKGKNILNFSQNFVNDYICLYSSFLSISELKMSYFHFILV